MQYADAVVLMTEWRKYRDLDFARMGELVADRVFIDLRNVYKPDAVRQGGLKYYSVGRAQNDIIEI